MPAHRCATLRDSHSIVHHRRSLYIADMGLILRLNSKLITTITQRPADIATSVISQMQTVVMHQLIAPADQTAIKSYLKDNAPRDTLNEVMGSLAALDRGERWIYSPRAGKLKRGISPLPRTFDTSRTPEPGEDPIEPKMLGELDLGEIAAALAPEKADDERIDAMLTLPSEADQVVRDAALLERDEQIAELTAKRDELIGRLADAEIKILELQNILGKVREAVGVVAQKDEDRSCATCSLCWNSERTISFLEH